ncbi:MAG: hypothetical protein KGL39_44160, partial [Patescibacteria group bacterium]|nr:hypothetical protein [Patescibacteria group bacterium]
MVVVAMVAAGNAAGTQQARWLADLQRVMRFDETGSDGFHRSWIMLFPQGEYEHPQYGELHFTAQRLSEIKRLFDERVRHIDIALDANHDQDKATGWLERLDLRPATASATGAGTGAGTPAGLWGLVRWTPYGMRLLKDQLYRYFSPEFGPWTDPASGRKYANVLIGGGLTNRPFLKEMPAVQLSGDGAQISQRSWASVNKSMLPRSCFLIVGDPAKKSTWRLPVYEGAGNIVGGVFERRGPLNINAVRAALAALGGAHTGKAMTGVPNGVRAKLEGWLKKYGGDKAQQASELAGGGVVEESNMAGKSGRSKPARENLEFDEETQSFADGASDDEEMADDEESQSYDEADGDGEDGEPDGGEQAPVDAKSDTHGAFDGRHAHGKFGMHTHDGEGDHSDAPLKSVKGGKKMSDMREGPRTATQLREAYDTQAQQ